MNEAWKPVAGYEGWYEVSNLGRVKRVRPHQSSAQSTSGVLSPRTSRGYKQVTLSMYDVQWHPLVHRLVALAFISNPGNKPQINHKNGIKIDNRVENLEWATRSENMRHALATGLLIPVHGEAHYAARLTQNDIDTIRTIYASGAVSQRMLGDVYGVDPSHICRIVQGKHRRLG